MLLLYSLPQNVEGFVLFGLFADGALFERPRRLLLACLGACSRVLCSVGASEAAPSAHRPSNLPVDEVKQRIAEVASGTGYGEPTLGAVGLNGRQRVSAYGTITRSVVALKRYRRAAVAT